MLVHLQIPSFDETVSEIEVMGGKTSANSKVGFCSLIDFNCFCVDVCRVSSGLSDQGDKKLTLRCYTDKREWSMVGAFSDSCKNA